MNNVIKLPLLITRGAIIFPNNSVTIEVARSFSKLAISESKKEASSLLLIVSQKDAGIDNPTTDDIYTVGTLCRILSFSELKSFSRIRVVGSSRVLIKKVEKENGFFSAEGQILENIQGTAKEEKALIKKMVEQFETAPEIARDLPKSVINQLSKGIDAVTLADMLSANLAMSLEERQKLLETLDINTRLITLLKLLSDEKENAVLERKLSDTVRESAEKSQKEYFLREKLKAIKQELGEEETLNNGEETIVEKLDKYPYPECVKTKIKAEIKRYEAMPQASLESSLIKQYIDTLMAIPWYQTTTDTDDIKNAEMILNEDHYGLKKVKERIVEYLAVKQMTGNLKAPILCFYGPPGVGKTSLGKSIARALGRKFFKASLGGVSDEAEIRGHRRTYVGSMPGRIINGMKKCGTINPVFLLDEIDKVGTSQKGDPASALLEVLDPEQNYMFNDNYVEEPYDLSHVLFIATANYLENVPGPLRDRLELIELNSYTEIEKLHIARGFLLEKELKANGLDANKCEFSDDAFIYIIEHYTRESGVRELQRRIASIIRKVIVDILKNKTEEKIIITVKEVKKYLGIEIFENSKKDGQNQIGVVTGLAYTQYGGDILPIEVNYFKGKGALVLTGKLGDVMKESANIALDYVRANADKYHIDNEIFINNDIHIHVPEGAVPKDGPSAGVAITTAIISCLTKKPVDSDCAMTGEVTLRGNALPIGGLREKSLAAIRSGIKRIIVPFENKKDVSELPDEVKKQLTIEFMHTVDDAVKFAILEK